MPTQEEERVYVKPPKLTEDYNVIPSEQIWFLDKAVSAFGKSTTVGTKKTLRRMRLHWRERLMLPQYGIDFALWVFTGDNDTHLLHQKATVGFLSTFVD